jgi:hypothetical protein
MALRTAHQPRRVHNLDGVLDPLHAQDLVIRVLNRRAVRLRKMSLRELNRHRRLPYTKSSPPPSARTNAHEPDHRDLPRQPRPPCVAGAGGRRAGRFSAASSQGGGGGYDGSVDASMNFRNSGDCATAKSPATSCGDVRPTGARRGLTFKNASSWRERSCTKAPFMWPKYFFFGNANARPGNFSRS